MPRKGPSSRSRSGGRRFPHGWRSCPSTRTVRTSSPGIAPVRIAVLTVSDAGSRGERADTSGDAIVAWAMARGDSIAVRELVPDETAAIVSRLLGWCDGDLA